MNDKLDFLWRTHAYINDYIRLADAKALGLLGVFGVLIGLILDRATGELSDVEKVLATGTVIASGAAMAAAGFAVFPRTRGRPTGTIYWKAIRSMSESQFVESTRGATEEELVDRLSKHLYEIAGIANEKYNALQFAFSVGTAALVLGLFLFALAVI